MFYFFHEDEDEEEKTFDERKRELTESDVDISSFSSACSFTGHGLDYSRYKSIEKYLDG